jgi:alkanesulfonate monooxygenase SsuD/methylene tetrahydromethanopterin reductase-like flavin-dependent oxidoreductase (luciferase family)
VRELNLAPKPVQRPHPPLYIGGGGKRILTFAAQEATIIGLAPRSTTAGMLDAATCATAEAVAEKVYWVRDAAGARLSDIELHIQVIGVAMTENRRHGAEMIAEQLAGLSSIAINTNLSIEQILESPQVLVGTVDQIVEILQERRERYGISYITVFGDIDAFSPVVARLAGT